MKYLFVKRKHIENIPMTQMAEKKHSFMKKFCFVPWQLLWFPTLAPRGSWAFGLHILLLLSTRSLGKGKAQSYFPA